MSKPDDGAISRRMLLLTAAASSVALFGTLGHSSVAVAATHPINSGTVADHGFTDINGVQAEYRDAISSFPLSLPTGWSFPPESALRDSVPGGLWEAGIGAAEAYLFWQGAMVTVAYEASLRGDEAQADQFLDLLEAGYGSPTRRAVVEDVDNLFVGEAIGAARGMKAVSRGARPVRDFSMLLEASAT